MQVLNTDSDPHQPAVTLSRFSYAYPEAPTRVLHEISLRIDPGQCHLLIGPTGSGKTTLLKAICGLLPSGTQSGEICVAGSTSRKRPRSAGLVLQNPKTQLLSPNLGADVAFGLENHCMPPSEMPERVGRSLKAVGLCQPFHLPVDTLSMGQQYRACLAGILVMDPLLILLDEPMGQLDPEGCKNILSIIKDLKCAGRAILISEHRAEALAGVIDHTWHLDRGGRIVAVPPGPSNINITEIAPDAEHRKKPSGDKPECVIEVEKPQFKNTRNVLDLSALSFRAFQGDHIVVCGPNGSGKTTLIRSLAGLSHPDSGSVAVFGTAPDLAMVRNRISVLFQNPQKQIFETTVFDEVAFFAQRSGMPAEQAEQQVRDMLHALGLFPIARSSPHKLSYGQQRMVGLASTLVGNPEILLLDDPFAGLDAVTADRLLLQVRTITAARGITVIRTTHAPPRTVCPADRVIDLPAGHKAPCPETTEGPNTGPPHSGADLRTQRKGLNTGMMLGLSLLLSMAAFTARTPLFLSALTGFNLTLVIIACPRPLQRLLKSAHLFAWQAALIVILYGIRFGIPDGFTPGICVAWQLFLALWPGMIFMWSNSQPRIMKTLSRLLPQRTAFVTATCMRFMPMLLSEMQQIRETQILRGARLLPKDLKTIRFLPDWLNCLLVPTLVKTLNLVSDIALAAEARDFGRHSKRTTWPGE